MANKVYLVGAGPGDPDLITIKGRDILRQADVIIYDYLVDKRLLEEADVTAELICCEQMGKKRNAPTLSIHQERIIGLTVKKAKEGKKVVRLKSGDPFVFARSSQEIEALIKNKIGFEIVPGVTAASAASALSGIPLTDRGLSSSCVFITGKENPSKKGSAIDWDKIAGCGTIVLYMAFESLDTIAQKLIKAGKSPLTPVGIIQDASLLSQKLLTGTLKDIAAKAKAQNMRPPAIIIIGETVKLEKSFDWLKRSKKVLFTGISPRRYFEKEIFFHLPMIKILPIKDYRAFDTALKGIGGYDWIILTSRYGVRYFFERLCAIGYDARQFSRAKIAVIGDSTRRELLAYGLIADLVPKDESSRGLINAFKKIDIKNKRLFIPRSDLSDKGITGRFEALGADVTAIVAYSNIMSDNLPDLDLNFFDEIKFSSPSGVRNFIKRYGKPPGKVKIGWIGHVTKNEVKRCGLLD